MRGLWGAALIVVLSVHGAAAQQPVETVPAVPMAGTDPDAGVDVL